MGLLAQAGPFPAAGLVAGRAGTRAVDLPERQHTLWAAVQWSLGLLEDAEPALLETAAVGVGGRLDHADAALQTSSGTSCSGMVWCRHGARHPRPSPGWAATLSRLRNLELVKVLVALSTASCPARW